jgi:hypothetical protein
MHGSGDVGGIDCQRHRAAPSAVTSVSVKFSDDKIASLEKLYVQHAVVGFVQSEPYANDL